MSPNSTEINKNVIFSEDIDDSKPERAPPRKHEIQYRPIITLLFYHLASLFGLYFCFTSAKWSTLVFAFFLYAMGELGVTVGVHRLWSHNSFKAKMPLQILLSAFYTLAFQGQVSHWVRDHRLHHKYSDTDWDPHNSSRGFFYSYVGWLITKKSKKLIEKGKKIDMSDIHSNPVLRFHEKNSTIIILTINVILPVFVPVYFWGESLLTAWHVNILRYVLNLHVSFLANTICHMVGYRPYDKNIAPSNNLFINLIALGDGFHNFHHAFPWDYRSSETGNTCFNFCTCFIDFFAWLGWAYDLRAVNEEVVKNRRERIGDGTDLWGRTDKELMKSVTRL